MKQEIRIGIAEDQDIVLEGLVSLLNPYKDIKVVFQANNGEELLRKIELVKVDVILLDLEMPVISGKEAFDIIKKTHPNLKILILSGTYSKSYVVEYIKRGANAFLPKSCGIKRLIEAITSVYFNGTFYDTEVTQMIVKALSEGKQKKLEVEFSEKELSIVKLICADKSTKEIASILSMSPRTIEYHRSVIQDKIGSKSISAIVKYALKNNIVEL